MARKKHWNAPNPEFKWFVKSELKTLSKSMANVEKMIPTVIENKVKIKILDRFMWVIISFFILLALTAIVAFAKNPTITGNAIKALFG